MSFALVPDKVHEQTLARLMTQYGDSLLHLCCVYLRDRALAEDAVQETFLKAFKALAAVRKESSEKAWLTHIAVNTCRDCLRTAWMRHIDRKTPLDSLPEPAANDEISDDTVIREVMRLPQRLRKVVLLRYYQDLKIRETAEALNISEEAVKARLRRANEKLRQRLEGWYDDE